MLPWLEATTELTPAGAAAAIPLPVCRLQRRGLAGASRQFRKSWWRRMVRVRIEIAQEAVRLEVIDPSRKKRVLSRNDRKNDPRITGSRGIIETSQHSANFIRVEQRPPVDAFIPAFRRGPRFAVGGRG